MRGLDTAGDDCVTGNQRVSLNHHGLIQNGVERLSGSALDDQRNLQTDGDKHSGRKKGRVLERGSCCWNIVRGRALQSGISAAGVLTLKWRCAGRRRAFTG
jgi:hypothetical protein